MTCGCNVPLWATFIEFVELQKQMCCVVLLQKNVQLSVDLTAPKCKEQKLVKKTRGRTQNLCKSYITGMSNKMYLYSLHDLLYLVSLLLLPKISFLGSWQRGQERFILDGADAISSSNLWLIQHISVHLPHLSIYLSLPSLFSVPLSLSTTLLSPHRGPAAFLLIQWLSCPEPVQQGCEKEVEEV